MEDPSRANDLSLRSALRAFREVYRSRSEFAPVISLRRTSLIRKRSRTLRVSSILNYQMDWFLSFGIGPFFFLLLLLLLLLPLVRINCPVVPGATGRETLPVNRRVGSGNPTAARRFDVSVASGEWLTGFDMSKSAPFDWTCIRINSSRWDGETNCMPCLASLGKWRQCRCNCIRPLCSPPRGARPHSTFPLHKTSATSTPRTLYNQNCNVTGLKIPAPS